MAYGNLKFWDIFCIGAGSMISSGIFVLPAIAYMQVGSGMLFSYIIAGLLMLPTLFTKLELATALPKAGGTYFFLDRILGAPVGMIAGLANWFAITFKSAFALLGIEAFLPMIMPELSIVSIKIISISICLFFMILNLFSVKSSGSMQVLLVIGLLAIMSEFVVVGYSEISWNYIVSIRIDDWSIIVATAGMVFISYGGITKIASLAEDIKDKRVMVRATIMAFIVVQIIYILVVIVLIGIMPADVLLASSAPLSEATRYFSFSHGINEIHFILMTIAAILAFITTANAGIMSASRVPMAMSRDKLLPSFFSTINAKGIPTVGIVITTMVMIVVILFFNLTSLAKMASLFMLLLFTGNNIALCVIRFSKNMHNYQPLYYSPFFPWAQILGFILYIGVIFTMGLQTIMLTIYFVLGSLALYYIYAHKQVKRRSAFMEIIARVTKRELKEREISLNDELFEIIKKREGIVHDDFDLAIQNAIIVDFKTTISKDEVVRYIAHSMHAHGLEHKSEQELYNQFMEREQLASTAIPVNNDYFALPHIIIEGENIFHMLVIRCLSGITWEPGIVVHTIFVLYCSLDRRSSHLQAIMNIAQIQQDNHYSKMWKKAQSVDALRSCLLLAKRQRKNIVNVEDVLG